VGQTAVLTGVSRAVLLAGTLALMGCTTLSRAYHTVADPVENAFNEPRHSTYARSSPPPPPALHSASTTEARPPPAADPTPVVVNGLSGTAVRAMLGQPTTRSGPAPGETWTYRSGSCEVELFLFPDVMHGGLHVLDYRVSGAGSRADGQQECLRRLRNAQS
jgi:hypothetical protein